MHDTVAFGNLLNMTPTQIALRITPETYRNLVMIRASREMESGGQRTGFAAIIADLINREARDRGLPNVLMHPAPEEPTREGEPQ